jgi:GGDEF domain-containing protein
MQYARRSEGTLIVLCAQLQKFQELRAELGPSAANHCVCEAAKLISGCLRRTDVVARVGEARFAAIAVDAAEPSVPVLRQRLESRVEAHRLSRGPWGEFEVQVEGRFWAANDNLTFQGLLEQVESGLAEERVPEKQRTT